MTTTHMGRTRSRAALALAVFLMAGMSRTIGAQDQTPIPHARDAASPSPIDACATAQASGTPMAGMDHAGMAMGTPVAMIEFDQTYMDMMIPHHAGILAMAEAARPRLQDDRLSQIADAIIAALGPEIDELRGHRERFYGSPEPLPMAPETMAQVTPGLPIDETIGQMDAVTQVAAFCSAPDPDLAFINLVISHHESAIAASETALDQAVHPEIRTLAERVIRDQQREIDELRAIRQELYASVTPQGSPAVSLGAPVSDQVSLVDTLRAEGMTVDVVDSLLPNVPFSRAQTGTTLRLSGPALTGSAEVQAYDYAEQAAAEADAGQILPDGNLPTVMIEWIAPPHFFRAGRVIVLYVGTDPMMLETLTRLLGPQFAGQ